MPSNNSLFAVLLCIIISTLTFAILTEPTPTNNDEVQPVNYFPYRERINMPTNLVPIPNAWTWGLGASSVFALGTNSNNTLDAVETYLGNSSLRQGPCAGYNNAYREIDGPYIAVKPGDTITFQVAIKTSNSTLGDNGNPLGGGAYGIDIYGANGRITGVNDADGSPAWTSGGGWNPDAAENFVTWGTAVWVVKTMTFTVPATYEADLYTAAYSPGTVVVPTAIIPVLTVQSSAFGYADGGSAWFYPISLTIVPLDETPLVEPTFSALTLNDASVLVDESVICSVTLAGGGGVPTGTVTFYVSEHNNTEVWNQLGVAVTLDAGGSVSSVSFRPGLAGIYLFRAEYSGDAVYTDFSSTDTLLTVNNPVTVTQLDNGVLRAMLLRMEKKSIGDYPWSPELWEPGMWENNTPLRKMLARLS